MDQQQHQPVDLRDVRVIRLTDDGPIRGPRFQRIRNADIVIDRHGQVIKERYGMGRRPATPEELDAAVPA